MTENIPPNIMSNMTGNLADQSFKMMTDGPSNRDVNWMKAYMESLINPFSLILKSPKLLDGEIKNSAAIKVRSTGEVLCSATQNTNIILFPGLTNVLCYCNEPNGLDNSTDPLTSPLTDNVLIDGTIFKQHLSTPADRSAVRLARLTGAGARFFLTNSAEEDDGYWEACRITNHQVDRDVFFKNDSSGALGAGILKALATDFDLANNSTYQFGQLRDIHKYVFKLNSEDNDHKYSPVNGLNSSSGTNPNYSTALADMDQWDMIFIKVRGRRNATSPSVLRFDTVANQEIVYSETSLLARMMEESARDPNIEGYLEYSRVDLPAFQAMQ